MVKKIGPLDIYRLLPQTNCEICGEKNCMAFATKLAERTVDLKACTPLYEEAKYKKNMETLEEMLRPPVREVSFGVGERAAKIGGKLVMYRHDLRYVNPTVLAIDVTDEMSTKDLKDRVKAVEELSYLYIGKKLRLDAIAVRSTSNDPSKFEKALRAIAKNTKLPLVLCSSNPQVIESGLKTVGDKRPLVYAATKDNWFEMGELAAEYNCPLVVHTQGDLKLLRSLTNTLEKFGIEDLVLDPGSTFSEGLGNVLDNFTMLRRAAVKEDDILLGYPLMGTPIVVWAGYDGPADVAKWNEAILASIQIIRFADILIMHSLDMWTVLPQMFLRENIYTDPQKPVDVEPGLRIIGKPDKKSPVLLTTNFALTYFTVSSDLESAKVDCYLLVTDTEGLSVSSAVAGRKLTGEIAAEAIKEFDVGSKVAHKNIVIPRMASRIRGDLEEASGWSVLVGPEDSSGIKKFLDEHWNQKD
ncbi:MAG: acetyl-CoA decarbonylase/synthase complex subunit gamma [Candidatus Hodarchaeota archaeon]